MTTKTADHPRLAHLVLFAAVALGLGAASCGTNLGPVNEDVVATPTSFSSVPQGYSYYHDSRINETPSTTSMQEIAATPTSSSSEPQGYSYDHDSRINETP